jgi:hypothetical protein
VDTDALTRAAARASQQYGLMTWRQALDAGLSPALVRRLINEGHWVRVARGLFRINGVKASWRGRMMAACLQAGDLAMVSHRSAAALWGIEGFEPPTTIDVTVPPAHRPRIEKARVHRRAVPRRTARNAIPVTPIPETILDLCAVSRNRAIPLRALDDVRRRKLVSSFELERCLAEHAPQRLAGISVYRALLERRLVRTPPGTVIAADVLDLLVGAGLPEPEAEVWVTICGRLYRIDLAYPRPKIAIECLGKIGHLNEKAFEEDPVRRNDFGLDGWLQIEVTWQRRLDHPRGIIAEVETALAQRGGA